MSYGAFAFENELSSPAQVRRLKDGFENVYFALTSFGLEPTLSTPKEQFQSFPSYSAKSG